jgi:hypothetical protein
MLALQLVLIELVVIGAGITAALTVGRRYVGRHRLNRRLRTEELAEIDKWLEAIRR